MDGQVVVRGEAERRTMPDWALLRVTIRGEGASRDDAYKAAEVDAATVDEVLGRSGAAPRSVGHGALVVQPKTKWRKGESVRTGWVATRGSTVEVVVLARLGELIAELAAAGGDVSSPEWQVDADNPAYQSARHDAAIDARQRAEAYVGALGLSVGEVRWVAEPGLRNPGDSHRVALAAASRTRGGADEDEVINISPPELTVRAEIEIGFELGSNEQPVHACDIGVVRPTRM